MTKRINGSFTIEAAIIVPMLLFLFSSFVHILFYYHDKNILMSSAHETAVVGSSWEQWSEIDLEYYFFSRMEGKMLLFNRVECLVTMTDNLVTVMCDGSKDSMKVKFQYDMPRIRHKNIRKE